MCTRLSHVSMCVCVCVCLLPKANLDEEQGNNAELVRYTAGIYNDPQCILHTTLFLPLFLHSFSRLHLFLRLLRLTLVSLTPSLPQLLLPSLPPSILPSFTSHLSRTTTPHHSLPPFPSLLNTIPHIFPLTPFPPKRHPSRCSLPPPLPCLPKHTIPHTCLIH